MRTKRNIIILMRATMLSCILFPFACIEAQDSAKIDTLIIKQESGYRHWSLTLGGATGYAAYQDLGTAPFNYQGAVIVPSIGFEVGGMSKWSFEIATDNSAGLFKQSVDDNFNFEAYEFSSLLRARAWRSVKKRLSIGLGAANFLSVSVNPNYENSSAGISEFIGPELSLRGKINATDWFNGSWWDNKVFTANVSLMPFAAVMRPGYAYTDNYTATHPVSDALFSDFIWHLQPFAELSSSVGVDFYTSIGTRISVAYLWSFFNSASQSSLSADYNESSRFCRASHSLKIDFEIPLVTQRIGRENHIDSEQPNVL